MVVVKGLYVMYGSVSGNLSFSLAEIPSSVGSIVSRLVVHTLYLHVFSSLMISIKLATVRLSMLEKISGPSVLTLPS